jgi:Arc/MetJ-type ribon-helix-helix transcriptional regulator
MTTRPVRKVTYSLPEQLVDKIRAVVREGAAPSYSAFVERALEEGVRRAREQRLAEAFREAASDPAFLEDVEEAMRDFRDADAEQEGSR